jgi:hypothetical protein
MIDYDRAELQAEHLLRELSLRHGAERDRRCLALRIACLVAGIEFVLLIAAAAFYIV